MKHQSSHSSTDGHCCYLLPCLSDHSTHFFSGRLLRKLWPWILKANPMLQRRENFLKHKPVSYFGGCRACPTLKLDYFQECMSYRARRSVWKREPALVGTLWHSNCIQRRNKARGRHSDAGSSPPSNDLTCEWQSWILTFLLPWPRIFHTPGPDNPPPACWVWWVYALILDADFLIWGSKKLAMWYVNSARSCWVSCLRLSYSQLMHWKKVVGGTAAAGNNARRSWKLSQGILH